MPRYVGVYCVSNFGNCQGSRRGLKNTYCKYLGLILINRNLSIVKDSDSRNHYVVAINLNEHLCDIISLPSGGGHPLKSKHHLLSAVRRLDAVKGIGGSIDFTVKQVYHAC